MSSSGPSGPGAAGGAGGANRASPATLSVPELDLDRSTRAAFVHIPKTAGMTLASYLEVLGPWSPAETYEVVPSLEGAQAGRDRSRYAYVWGHLDQPLIEAGFGGDRIWLTLLREPLARARSALDQVARFEPHPKVQAARGEGLEAARRCVLGDDELVGWHLGDLQFRMLGGRGGSPGDPGPGRVEPEELARVLARLEGYAFFGLTERMADSLDLLCFTFGWPPVHAPGWANATPEDQRLRLAPELAARFEALNQADLAIYPMAAARFEARYQGMLASLGARGHLVPPPDRAAPSRARVLEALERHFEARMGARTRPARFLYRAIGEREVGPIGWHRREWGQEGPPVRWTGPGRDATLPLALDRSVGLRIGVQAIDVQGPNRMEDITLLVDGVERAPTALPAPQYGRWLVTEVPAEPGRPPGPTWVGVRMAAEPGLAPGGDGRSLGAMVAAVEVQPVGAEAAPLAGPDPRALLPRPDPASTLVLVDARGPGGGPAPADPEIWSLLGLVADACPDQAVAVADGIPGGPGPEVPPGCRTVIHLGSGHSGGAWGLPKEARLLAWEATWPGLVRDGFVKPRDAFEEPGMVPPDPWIAVAIDGPDPKEVVEQVLEALASQLGEFARTIGAGFVLLPSRPGVAPGVTRFGRRLAARLEGMAPVRDWTGAPVPDLRAVLARASLVVADRGFPLRWAWRSFVPGIGITFWHGAVEIREAQAERGLGLMEIGPTDLRKRLLIGLLHEVWSRRAQFFQRCNATEPLIVPRLEGFVRAAREAIEAGRAPVWPEPAAPFPPLLSARPWWR